MDENCLYGAGEKVLHGRLEWIHEPGDILCWCGHSNIVHAFKDGFCADWNCAYDPEWEPNHLKYVRCKCRKLDPNIRSPDYSILYFPFHLLKALLSPWNWQFVRDSKGIIDPELKGKSIEEVGEIVTRRWKESHKND